MPKTNFIVLDGLSGAGKTEVAKVLSQELNAPIIIGDYLMYGMLFRKPKKLIKIFGEAPKKDEDPVDFLKRKFDVETVEKSTALLTEAYKPMNTITGFIKMFPKLLKKEEMGQVLLNKDGDYQFVILDWISTNRLKLWKKAHTRILVETSSEHRTNRLLERAKGEITGGNEDFPSVRETAYTPFVEAAQTTADFTITNDGTLEELENQAKQIATQIKGE